MLCDIKFLSDVMGELYLWVSSEGSMPSGATLQTGATNKKWKVTFSNNNGVYVSEDWFMAITWPVKAVWLPLRKNGKITTSS